MDKKALEKAQQELKEFLNEHPHLQELQNHLDQMLNHCDDDPQVRLVFLFKVMRECLEYELLPSVNRLNSILHEIKEDQKKRDAS